MKTIPLAIAVLLPALSTSAFAASGDELLQKVKARYASCAGFKAEGETKTTSNMMGKENPHRSEKRFGIWFKRPDLLRVDWSEPSMASFTPVVCSLYTENGKYFGVSSFKRTPEEFNSLDMGMGAYAGISGGTTYLIPSMLLGKTGYFTEAAAEILPDVKINGEDCSVLEFTDKRTGKWTVTINKDTLAIVECRQIKTITAEQSKAMMEEAKARMKDKHIPFPMAPAQDYTIETVTTFKNASFDQEMAAADFVFNEDKKPN